MRRPVAAFGGAYILTQLAAVTLPPAAFLPLAAVFVCGCIVACACGRRGAVRILPAAVLTGVIVQCIGFAMLVRPAYSLAGRQVDALAEVVSAEPGFGEDTARVRLKLLDAAWGEERFSVPALVSVDVFPECEAGQRFRVTLFVEQQEADDYLYSDLADGAYLQAGCQGDPVPAGRSDSPVYGLARFRQEFSAHVARYLPEEEGGVLAAMACGDKSRLPDELAEQYRDAGISHLLVVSGLHLSLVCGVLGSRIGRFRRVRALANIAFVLFMMALTGFTASVMRAGIGALIFQLGNLLLLPADPLTSMGIAAVLISLQGPYAVCDLAFQLSFTSTLGVVLAGSLLRSMRARRGEGKGEAFFTRLCDHVADLMLPTVLAALFTLPVQLLGGLSVSGVAVLANLLALRLVGYCVVLGMLAGASGFFPWLDFAARAFSLVGGLLAKLLNAIAAFCCGLPLAQLPLPREYSLVVLAALGSLTICAWRLGCARQLWKMLVPLAMLGVCWAFALEQGTVEIVLSGSAATPCVVAIQDGQALVIFRGGDSNAGKVMELLKSRGIARAQCVVDLRANASSPPPEGEHTIRIADFSVNQARSTAVCDIMVTAIRLRSGSLALLDIGGYKIAVPAGSASTGTPLQVDLAVTGSTEPGNLRAETLITRMACDWQGRQTADVYYGPRSVRVLLRPGRSAVLKGGNYALQQDAVA